MPLNVRAVVSEVGLLGVKLDQIVGGLVCNAKEKLTF